MTRPLNPTGPSEPGRAPKAASISAGAEKVSGESMPAIFSAFSSFRVWSPRTSSSTGPSLPLTTTALTVALMSTFRKDTRSAMVLTFGVCTLFSGALAAGRGVAGATASASSTLAA